MSVSPMRLHHRGQRARAVEHARHLEPAAGHRVGEIVEHGLRLRRVAVGGDDKDRGGAERDEPLAVLDAADADRPGAAIAAARGDRDAGGQPEPFRHLAAEPAAHLGALMEARHVTLRDADRGEHLRRPAASRLVEELGAGGVRHVGGELAGEVEADVVLGEEDMGDAGEDHPADGP